MIVKFLCWIGLHDLVVHYFERVEHKTRESIMYAACSRCNHTQVQACGWKAMRQEMRKNLAKDEA